MNKKGKLKIIFTISLTTILVLMISLSISTNNISTSMNDILNERLDYTLIFKADKCTSGKNLIYKEENKEFYIECYSLNDVYVNWSNAKIDKLEDCLKNGKVNIDSLKNHGLDIEVVEVYEN